MDATAMGSSLRRNSRRRSIRLMAIWIVTEATERYQMCSILKPGMRDQMIAGIAKRISRSADAKSGGKVLPSPWKVLDETKISPWATKFNEMIVRNWTPGSSTAGSFENGSISERGEIWQRMV